MLRDHRNGSRFQRSDLRCKMPGALPQAIDELRPLAQGARNR